MLILYKRSHVEYHGRFTARFLKRIQLGSPGLKTGLDKLYNLLSDTVRDLTNLNFGAKYLHYDVF